MRVRAGWLVILPIWDCARATASPPMGAIRMRISSPGWPACAAASCMYRSTTPSPAKNSPTSCTSPVLGWSLPQHHSGNLDGIGVRTRRLEDLVAVARDTTIEPAEARPAGETLAQIVYTSGTTAAPKGAMMTQGRCWRSITRLFIISNTRTDRALAALPLYHTAQMHAFTMPQMMVGAHTT